MAFQIQILSDLHLESPKSYTGETAFFIPPKAPYLALLGDVGNAVHHKTEYLSLLEAQLRKFEVVLLVPGNHEAYHSTWPDTLKVLRDFEEDVKVKRSHQVREKEEEGKLGEFILLNRTTFIPTSHPRIAVLGCPLFSAIPPLSKDDISSGLQDFYPGVGTSNWSVDDHNTAHEADLEWLNTTVSALNQDPKIEKIIIFTHWTPTRDERSIAPPYRNGSKLTAGFSTDLSREVCFTSGKVMVWGFGHTHFNCDFQVQRMGGDDGNKPEEEVQVVGPLRLLANQRGNYFRQAAGFNLEKVVEL